MAVLTLRPEDRLSALRRQRAGLRRLRARLGLTQAQMARRLNMSTENLSLYERGEQPVTLLHLTAWADAYEVTRSELIEAVGLLAEPAPGEWWGRAELEAEEMPADEIERIEATLIDRPLDHQRAVLDVFLREWRKRRRRRHPRPDSDADADGAAS